MDIEGGGLDPAIIDDPNANYERELKRHLAAIRQNKNIINVTKLNFCMVSFWPLKQSFSLKYMQNRETNGE